MSSRLWGLLVAAMFSTLVAAEPKTVTLWEGKAPGALGSSPEDTPTITIYLANQPKIPTGVVVFPGGGYVHLAVDHEGVQVASWLNERGISAFVVKYRLGPRYRHPIEMHDGQRAVRYVRAHAGEFGIDTNRIGVWGFSAGGHLASTVGTHFDDGDASAADAIDRQSSRPDFLVLAYPVIAMEGPYVHLGSQHALLGEPPDSKLAHDLSNETQVTKNTPPTFLFHTTDDTVVPVENSLEFYAALRKAGVPCEMHIYAHGKHGVGLAQANPVLQSWTVRLESWLKVQHYF